MLSALKNIVADTLWLGALRKHKSRMGWKDAPRYSEYRLNAQTLTGEVDDETATRARHFDQKGWASYEDAQAQSLAASMLEKIKSEETGGAQVFDHDGRYMLGDLYQKFPEVDAYLRGKTGDFLRATFGSHFKIYYGVCYKSVHNPEGPSGSQLWHADGGPGTCINLMWCISPVGRENGAMECLDWSDSLGLFERERSATRAAAASETDRMKKRSVVSNYYRDAIAKNLSGKINQPVSDKPGLSFAFSNNTIHKGGYPQPGHERYVCVFHVYPSALPTPFDRYKALGIQKTGSNPSDPAFGDAG